MSPTVFEDRDALAAQRRRWREAGERVALVPTMGNLHEGHLGLIAFAKQRADRVLATIFVNPSQFGAGEDFERYPRTLPEDLAALARVDCDGVFVPAVNAIYPDGLPPRTRVTPGPLADDLCGAHRRGHFEGVATVVLRLFNLTQPDLAIFGEKDFQQLLIIRQMAADLALPLEILGAPIARDARGLALSSRNGYLSEQDRMRAAALQQTLQRVVAKAQTSTQPPDWPAVCGQAEHALEALGFVVDYLTVRRQADLLRPSAEDRALVALVAAKLGTTRLIDNLCFQL